MRQPAKIIQRKQFVFIDGDTTNLVALFTSPVAEGLASIHDSNEEVSRLINAGTLFRRTQIMSE
jgi:hypothetical protein